MVLEVFDTRPAVKEEVMSLANLEVEGVRCQQSRRLAVEQSDEYKQRQQQRIAEAAVKADIIIITTAMIPVKSTGTDNRRN